MFQEIFVCFLGIQLKRKEKYILDSKTWKKEKNTGKYSAQFSSFLAFYNIPKIDRKKCWRMTKLNNEACTNISDIWPCQHSVGWVSLLVRQWIGYISIYKLISWDIITTCQRKCWFSMCLQNSSYLIRNWDLTTSKSFLWYLVPGYKDCPFIASSYIVQVLLSKSVWYKTS